MPMATVTSCRARRVWSPSPRRCPCSSRPSPGWHSSAGGGEDRRPRNPFADLPNDLPPAPAWRASADDTAPGFPSPVARPRLVRPVVPVRQYGRRRAGHRRPTEFRRYRLRVRASHRPPHAVEGLAKRLGPDLLGGIIGRNTQDKKNRGYYRAEYPGQKKPRPGAGHCREWITHD